MEYLPLFPLGFCLLPGQEKELHIFEARYKQLFADCLVKDITFGVPFIQDGQLAEYGTTATLKRIVRKYPTGELDVIITGQNVFKLIDFNETHVIKEYPAGNVELLATEYLKVKSQLHGEFLQYARNYLPSPEMIAQTPLTIYHIAALLGLSETEKYDILACFSNGVLNNKLLNKLRVKTAITRQETALKGKFHLN